MKESRNLEFKSQVSNSFLKTVSAFANFGSGTILFGIDDNGNGNYKPADYSVKGKVEK